MAFVLALLMMIVLCIGIVGFIVWAFRQWRTAEKYRYLIRLHNAMPAGAGAGPVRSPAAARHDDEPPQLKPDVGRPRGGSVSNTISPQELEDMNLPQLGRRLNFKHAGSIRPLGAGGACEALMINDVTTCVLYVEIVDGQVKKFGTTRSVQERERLNRNTINHILAFQDRRYRGINKKITDPSTYDKFKQQAPGLIRDGKRIEIWATSLSSYAACQGTMGRRNAQCLACKNVEAALNAQYKTIEFGWATRLN